MQEQIIEKKLKFYVIDAYKVAKDTGMGARINTIMQTCFFAISGVLPRDEAIEQIKKAIKKTYGKKGDEVVQKNFAAVDHTLAHLHEVKVPGQGHGHAPHAADRCPTRRPSSSSSVTADDDGRQGRPAAGQRVPGGRHLADRHHAVGEAQHRPGDPGVGPGDLHPVQQVRAGLPARRHPRQGLRPEAARQARRRRSSPSTPRATEFKGMKYTIQVAPEDCTGCGALRRGLPGQGQGEPEAQGDQHGAAAAAARAGARELRVLPRPARGRPHARSRSDVKGAQFLQPLFEYSGACAGCGETPYVKLLTQLFGDRALIANATGCSSIYGGNLPTTPYAMNRDGRGPAWSNSLFEDNAEFGFGMRLAVDKHTEQARELLHELAPADRRRRWSTSCSTADQDDEAGIDAQRERVAALQGRSSPAIDDARGRWPRAARRLPGQEERLDRRRRRLGLRHRLRRPRPRARSGPQRQHPGARHRGLLQHRRPGVEGHAARRRRPSSRRPARARPKKDLGLIAMTYGNVYVAHVAIGAKDAQTVQAFQEAEAYPGPSLIIAYSHCIAHGYDLRTGCEQQKLAVDTGYWPLYRFDPRRIAHGESPLKLDSAAPKVELAKYIAQRDPLPDGRAGQPGALQAPARASPSAR